MRNESLPFRYEPFHGISDVSARGQGIRISTNDLQIAAIAIEMDRVVVTRNLRDFEQVPGLQLENWFQG